MAFDDLAKHMAARDGKKKAMITGDANQIIAEAAKANARLNRQRDLILGPLLLVFGVGVCAAWLYMFLVGFDELGRANQGGVFRIAIGALLIGPFAVFLGSKKLIRGLRNKSSDDSAEHDELFDAYRGKN
jgi:hypothetical protein